jgi:alkanesulfonate monooxygenase SsuD/methylene tetrahydromethanopterin reductase-like flavin-dependent oxidoreductase (luciferase family)
LTTPDQAGQYYNWSLDELIYGAKAGMDGICVNEHHQNAYGNMPGPNLMGAILARATAGTDVAIVQMGATLPTTNPPIRIAEEYAMLDCISGGRVIAGMPLGTAMDANFCYGITPIEQRERYYEAHDLILKAWQSKEIFAWNGKYTQLPMVNIWPRPVQQPHPPVWVPGGGSLSTWDFAAQHDHCYCYLSFFGAKMAKGVMDGFWEFVATSGRDQNPYRAGFAQIVAVAESDAQAEEDYYQHIRYFFDKCLHIAPEFAASPGYQDYKSLANTMRKQFGQARAMQDELPNWKFKDFVENGLVIAGGPATVRDRLVDLAKNLRVGNLMVLLHIGSMPHELTLKNIDMFAREVQPHIRDIWDDEWENHWWPQSLRHKRELPVGAAARAGAGDGS